VAGLETALSRYIILSDEKMMERMLNEIKSYKEMLTKMEAKADATLKEMKEKIKASKEEIIGGMKFWREKIESCQEPGRTEIKTGQEEVMALDLEAIPEKAGVVTELQKVPKGEAAVKTVRALKKVCGDQHLP
jgi:hypothetical protein